MNFSSVQQLHPNIKIIFSSKSDGSMAAGGGKSSDKVHHQNADKFLLKHGFSLQRTRLFTTYGASHSYRKVIRLTPENINQDIEADAIYTTSKNHVLTLPVADCIATVVYDPKVNLLGILHLGRHASVYGLIEDFVKSSEYAGSNPVDWLVWMSPSIRFPDDQLDYFEPPNIENWREYMELVNDKILIDNIGHNRQRFLKAGVKKTNVKISPISTYSDERFFSHRAANEQNNQHRQGRMMVAAQIIS